MTILAWALVIFAIYAFGVGIWESRLVQCTECSTGRFSTWSKCDNPNYETRQCNNCGKSQFRRVEWIKGGEK